MMDYEIFKEVTAEKFKDYLPDNMKDMRLDIRPIEKVNEKLDAITFYNEQVGKPQVSPTIYINDMYREYTHTNDLEGTFHHAADKVAAAVRMAGELLPDADIDWSNAKDRIVFQLINTEQNKEMLSDMPNRPFQDLSIIYRYVAQIEKDSLMSIKITKDMAERLGFSEEQLFHLAAENTRKLMPPKIRTMNEILHEILAKEGMPPEMADSFIGDIPEDMMMWVISNEQGLNGAASMLYEDNLQKLATDLKSDLYIMPSSIHEVIAVPADMGSPEELAAMVAEINMDQVELSERLSNQVYHYDKDLRKLTLATDTPNKRLDGIVAEPAPIYAEKEQAR